MLKPKLVINSLAISFQLWRHPWPHTVITLWWPWRLRVYYWRGKVVKKWK